MRKLLLICSLSALCISTGNAEGNNLFLDSYPEYVPPKVEKKQTPKPVKAAAVTDQTGTQFVDTSYNYWEVGKEEHHDGSSVASGEIVTSEVKSSEDRFPEVMPVPETKPEVKPKPAVVADEEVKADKPATFDLSGCRYGGKACWSNKGLSQKIQKIVENVNYLNKIHKAKLDPRYLLCTGWRESTFNPGAVGGQGEKGMFQVMNATGRAALRYGPKILPKDQYMTKMVNSTLAQTELSFLTLKMKVAEGASKRCLEGGASIEDYRDLARRYNGAGAAAYRYANAIKNCYSCMRSTFSNINGALNESKARSCLNRAKH